MKLTESKLKQIIVEELQKILVEQESEVFERKETPSQILRRLSKKHGGVKGIRKLSRRDPDRLAYRAAYKAQRAQGKKGKTTAAMPEPRLTGRKKARAVEPAPADDVTSKKIAARLAKTKKELGGYGKAGKKVAPLSDFERKMQQALARTPNEPYSPASAGSQFKTAAIPKPVSADTSDLTQTDVAYEPKRSRRAIMRQRAKQYAQDAVGTAVEPVMNKPVP